MKVLNDPEESGGSPRDINFGFFKSVLSLTFVSTLSNVVDDSFNDSMGFCVLASGILVSMIADRKTVISDRTNS